MRKCGEELCSKSQSLTVFYQFKLPSVYIQLLFYSFYNDRIIIKARGKAISKAVDIAEITKHKFIQTAKYENIKLDTETLDGENGPSNVSSIEIVLVK